MLSSATDNEAGTTRATAIIKPLPLYFLFVQRLNVLSSATDNEAGASRPTPTLEVVTGENPPYLPGIFDADVNFSMIEFLAQCRQEIGEERRLTSMNDAHVRGTEMTTHCGAKPGHFEIIPTSERAFK